MVCVFESQYSTYGAPPELAQFGEPVVYVPSSGSPSASININAIVGDEIVTEQPRPDGRWEVRTRTFEFSSDPTLATHGGIADPRTTDKITLNAEVWDIVNTAGHQDGMHAATAMRERKLETAHPGFRNPHPVTGGGR